MIPVAVRRLADEVAPCDVIVVGSGVAGLSAALGLAAAGRRVRILTKADLGGGSSSEWAQGGVAAAMASEDSPLAHARDTLAAGAGIGEEPVIAALTGEGPERIRRLIALGGRFDRDARGELALGREAAHSRRRILHANGDATGREMVRALRAALAAHDGVEVAERVFAGDLVLAGEQVVGGLARHADGRAVFHRAGAVVLATGGCGQLYRYTTNPVEATGDGLAMAARAGAQLADLELMQFHPTALLVDRDPLPLVTEALRGEGATLLDGRGARFMLAEHPQAELAPRDVVARAIFRRQRAGETVVLDATRAVGAAFPDRFPTVWAHCQAHGLDPRCQPIPVTPAAHYAMAGVAVDGQGRTSLPGLWACGEVSSTGVHGANRLASNSLLEALVFGARVAEDVAGRSAAPPALRAADDEVVWSEPGSGAAGDGRILDLEAARQQVRRLMWERVGLERDAAGLEQALAELERLDAAATPHDATAALQHGELRNLLTVGRLVSAAALARRESRGSHYRTDLPHADPGLQRRLFWSYDPVAGAFPLVAVPRFDAPAVAAASQGFA